VKRTVVAGVIVALVLVVLTGGWSATGWRALRTETEALARAPMEKATRRASELASTVASRLEALRATESERPYFHYRNLYQDPRSGSFGGSVAPSPLAERWGDPLVAVHYQIEADGRVTLPSLNEELPELSASTRLAESRAARADLERARGDISARLERDLTSAEVHAVDPATYLQNLDPNRAARLLRGDARPPMTASPRAGAVAVRVRVGPLRWQTIAIGGEPRLVALRTVETPDGRFGQGLTVALERLGAHVVPGAPRGPLEARLPLAGVDWHVEIDAERELAEAALGANALRRRFFVELVPVVLLALALGVVVVVMVARAERLAAERSRFAASAAHELRTPLAGLVLYGEMLAEGLGNPARAADYAGRIADEATRLGRVVNNVLGFTQLEQGAIATKIVDGNVALAVRDAVDRARPALQHAGVTLRLTLGAEPLPARFDADAVGRILQNLLDNAEKYGRGRSARTVEVRATTSADGVAIDVVDDGPGLPTPLKRRPFRPFVRGGGADAPAGLGLGLPLSGALAIAMGGSLEYRDAQAGGACFTLRLPRGR